MKIVFTWDDGSLFDKRLFDLHRKYSIPGMFFVPTHNIEGRETVDADCIASNASDLISFGCHTEDHVFLTTIDINDVEAELVSNKEYLEQIVGHEVKHFCLPGGKYNKQILELVFKHFETCRTADTFNLCNKGRLIKPSVHLYVRSNKSIFGNCLRHRSFKFLMFNLFHLKMDYFSKIKKLIEMCDKKRDSCIVIWGHSWEIEEHNLWDNVEDLFAFVKELHGKSVCHYDDLFI